eukprot:TRINITY_DN14753_c0_g1_i2.p3 TRINITY_DN14753_c0_g1~~TRINITY_DN14753_c0_g1_i2.p3  ORF type:complete len:105 (-),score=25.18 TRINITY_DN14753_c0_g1_i2:26-340(-)
MIRRPPRSTLSSSSAASDVYKRQEIIGFKEKCFNKDNIRLIPMDLRKVIYEELQRKQEFYSRRIFYKNTKRAKEIIQKNNCIDVFFELIMYAQYDQISKRFKKK